jgi:hypothetical protein
MLGDLSYIINLLKRKDDFTDRELDILQEHIDTWAENWIAVNGREGCTNHTHILTCQGWEYQNRLVVYLGKDMVGKAVDDFLNRKCVAWSHACFVVCL